ncbi:hypothetical protein SAMN05216319_2749 [Duganella sp. CF402]|uniref:hypothetical protein n=1 Tax=unclassified Duganella TaxID=2636909 RepID=UPI0008BAEB39|nr:MULTISPECIES: hypothetical protein [unclassified Duganella]RZT08834.1 hypothetical protein EV582_0872 [Duganella sp. BK701]SEL80150.1 hypothetical protein SAMN05216319_2749 [Duganella sp. CF402]
MELSKQSSRKLIVAGAATAAVTLGVAAYFIGSTPAESQVTLKVPMSASASASASKAASAAKAAPSATPQRPAEVKDPAPPAEPKPIRSKEQGAAALMALPELQAWSALIEKNTGGKAHGGLLEYDPMPRKLNGKSYWQFSYVENSAESALRWESFLVSSNDDEILVEDATNDEVISLARWRREKHPSKRTSVGN